jgi:hypothetical protein
MAVITYCTTTDIKTQNPKRDYDTSSRPTLAQVNRIIQEVSGEMDSRFSAVGIAVPISTSPVTQASLLLRRICAFGAACNAEESAFMGGHAQQSTHVDWLCGQYEELMTKIEDDPGILGPGTGGSSTGTANSYELENSDKRRTASEEPFTRDENRW